MFWINPKEKGLKILINLINNGGSFKVDLSQASFKVGLDEGQRKAKLLYLVLSNSDEANFVFEKAAKSYTLTLPFILKKSGVDFAKKNTTLRFVFSSMKARPPLN